MKEFEVGETVLIPVKIEDKTSSAYWVRYGNEVFWASREYVVDNAEGKTYEDGLNDAWEAARNIFCDDKHGGMSLEDIQSIFGECSSSYIANNVSAQDAVGKIKAWEDANAIRVGDIVEVMGGVKGLVTKIKDGCYYIIFSDGSCRKTNEGEAIKKTGRNADISSYLFGIFGV